MRLSTPAGNRGTLRVVGEPLEEILRAPFGVVAQLPSVARSGQRTFLTTLDFS